MIAPLRLQRDPVAGLNRKWLGIRTCGKNRGIGFDPATACLDCDEPVAVKRKTLGFRLDQTASRLEDIIDERLDQTARIDGVAIVGNVFSVFRVRREIRIKGAKLFLVELLPDDAVIAPESPAARIRCHTFFGAIDDEDAIALDEILCSGVVDQWHESVEARGDQRFEGLCLLPDFVGHSGQPVAEQPGGDLGQIGPADRQRSERIHQIFGNLLKRVGSCDGDK